jgi:geranylgeranyl diphosphate synthase type I
MTATPAVDAPRALLELRDRCNDALRDFLRSRRQEAEWTDPRATILVDEVIRLIEAGGKRLRPAFCYWGYRAAGGIDDDRIIKASAALELLHTFALIHDDVMDGAKERRGLPASQPFLEAVARERNLPVDAAAFGLSVAILAGDLAAVLADQLFLESGFQQAVLSRALGRYHEMRIEMAAGQVLDLHGPPADEREARRIAAMRGGGYTVERPLLIGATLAGAPMQVVAKLTRFGAPLGEAFQLADDIVDRGAAANVSPAVVRELIAEARQALDPAVFDEQSVTALHALADSIVVP